MLNTARARITNSTTNTPSAANHGTRGRAVRIGVSARIIPGGDGLADHLARNVRENGVRDEAISLPRVVEHRREQLVAGVRMAFECRSEVGDRKAVRPRDLEYPGVQRVDVRFREAGSKIQADPDRSAEASK